MLAGPQLIGIQPNQGELIVDGSVRDTSPRTLTLAFDDGQVIDADTLAGIQLIGAGPNDTLFGNGNDVVIDPASVEVDAAEPNEVIVRFTDPLPDDNYQLRVSSIDDPVAGLVALRNQSGEALMPAVAGDEGDVINFTLNLGAQVRSVVPQPVIRDGDGNLRQNRNEITVYFSDDPLFVEDEFRATLGGGAGRVAVVAAFPDGGLPNATVTTATGPLAASYSDAGGLSVTAPAGASAADVAAVITSVDRFTASVQSAGTFTPGGDTAVTPQPTARSAENPRFYQLLLTRETIRTTDDSLYFPERVEYDDATFTARLFFADDLNELGVDADGNAGPGVSGATYRLRIGTAVDERADLIALPTPVSVNQEPGSTLDTALVLPTLGTGVRDALTIQEEIRGGDFRIEFPGGELNRNPGFAPDLTAGVPTVFYNFNGVYENVGAVSRLNQIIDVQETRIREVLELYAGELGVQFVETEDEGITFAVGALGTLAPNVGGLGITSPNFTGTDVSVGFDLRIDPDFDDAVVLFSNGIDFDTTFGGDFTRRAAAAVGLALGLSPTPTAGAQNILALNQDFITNPGPSGGATATDLEPVFPGPLDVIQGRNLYRPDSIDVDLYRFDIDLGDDDRLGDLTVETFAERLPRASSLDTTVTLFEEVRATATTTFGLAGSPSFVFRAVPEGKAGNDIEIRFVRGPGSGDVTVERAVDNDGNELDTVLLVDIPRDGSATVGDVIGALQDYNAAAAGDPNATALFTIELTDAGGEALDLMALDPEVQTIVDSRIDDRFELRPIELTGGNLVPLVRNDDYFSEDSRITAALSEGVYYIGVSAAGNETYDPVLADTGLGGRSEGRYELNVRFEPRVDETEALRDRDGGIDGVPGTRIDGDLDGSPGGEFNFWFQTRALDRVLDFTTDGDSFPAGETIRVIDFDGNSRVFEFDGGPDDPNGPGVRTGNVAVPIGGRSAAGIAREFVNALNRTLGRTEPDDAGNPVDVVAASIDPADPARVRLVGDQTLELSPELTGVRVYGRTLFVDKGSTVEADGSLSSPFNNVNNDAVPNALGAALPGDIVRIVGNGGNDDDLSTESDNVPYLFGVSNTGGRVLEDGRDLLVPQGVTVMVDAGAILKFRGARVGVGSTVTTDDRSGGAFQVLGATTLLDLSIHDGVDGAGRLIVPGPGEVSTTEIPESGPSDLYRHGSVIFTSINDSTVGASNESNGNPRRGDWGGIVYRRDLDVTEGRADLEDNGIFLQSVRQADLIYGGGSDLLIDSVQTTVNPIQVFGTRPTIAFNQIRQSADAAISASPDSFLETSYSEPQFQVAGEFVPDYERIGPDIDGNVIVDNSINALFVRIVTTPTRPPQELTVAGRFNDTDIVHYLAENLILRGNPGGNLVETTIPDATIITATDIAGGTLAAGDYRYRVTFVDAAGFESAPSVPSSTFTVDGGNGSLFVRNLPPLPADADSDFVARRLYRSGDGGPFRLVTRLDGSVTSFLDDGSTTDGILDPTLDGTRPRLDASLVIDPSTVVKLRGTRIELGFGTHLYAEGLRRDPVIFTSFADDRFGAGGTSDTTDDNGPGESQPERGDWAGIYAAPGSTISIDNARVAYGGGVSILPGGVTRGFAPLELQLVEDARVANSVFEFNAAGQAGAGPIDRAGRLGVTPSTIFVRGNQPVIVGNDFVDNRGTTIDIDIESLNADRLVDTGRQTIFVDAFTDLEDNFGPLIRRNRFENVAATDLNSRQLSGLEVRGGVVTSDVVLDDTDIDHLLFDSIVVGNSRTARFISRPGQSLVIKLDGPGSPYEQNFGTGITATGTPDGDADVIGGAVQIVGVPGSPVVLTSLFDDTVGSSSTLSGGPLLDTGGDGAASRPEGNDWRSVLFDRFSHNRNVDFILEESIATLPVPDLNGTTGTAQFLGTLASNELSGDEAQRLGFDVQGFVNADDDVDVYSFNGSSGTRVFLDVDRTSFALDTVVELLDQDGNVLARSDNSGDEFAASPIGSDALEDVDFTITDGVGTLSPLFPAAELTDTGAFNERDAGLSVVLPGAVGSESAFFVRVRSDSANPDDVDGGQTGGGYRFQIRLREAQETPGSVVRFADIRFANHGIHLVGLVGDSPLIGDAAENEGVQEEPFFQDIANDPTDPRAISNDAIVVVDDGFVTVGPQDANIAALTPQYIGDLNRTIDGTLSVAGELSPPQIFGGDVNSFTTDIDFYRFDIGPGDATRPTVIDIDYADGFSRPDTELVLFFDPDGDDTDNNGDSLPRLVARGSGSNISDDQQVSDNADPLSLLTRGSVTSGDPFIGPLTLVPGVYYVGVIPQGSTIDALQSPFVRREPVESLVRIFDDAVGGDRDNTAADPRVAGGFVDPTNSVGFTPSTQRQTTPGSQPLATFNQSRPGDPLSEVFIPVTGDAVGPGPDATLIDRFSLAFNRNIGDEDENTSQFIPHATVFGALGDTFGNDQVDVIAFDVPANDSTVILDVDFGASPRVFDPDAEGLPEDFLPTDGAASVETALFVFDAAGDLIRTDLLSLVTDGEAGSAPVFLGSNVSQDPFIEFSGITALDAGRYFAAVAPVGSTFDTATGEIVPGDGDGFDGVGTYQLQVSIEGASIDVPATGNQAFFFDRQPGTDGTLTSRTFDLSDYGVADLPTFYVDYLLIGDGDDSVTFTVIADGVRTNVPVTLVDSSDDDTLTVFRQAVVDLGVAAGAEDVTLEITYTVDTTANGGEGLYLDNFIVGFAERGELITGSGEGSTGIVAPVTFDPNTGEFRGTALAGDYQLEIRPASDYASGGVTPTRSFDTNTRLVRGISLVAPFPDEIDDGDTFTLTVDNASTTFEFSTDGTPEPGNIAVDINGLAGVGQPFAPTIPGETEAERVARVRQRNEGQNAIAAAIRDAINGPIASNTLGLTASAQGESASQAADGNLVALDRIVTGDFVAVAFDDDLRDATGATAGGGDSVRLAAVYYDLLGDSNDVRGASSTIVDSNRISDVRAVGIYSEPGERDDDPQTLVPGPGEPYTQLAPLGRSSYGAAKALPTPNDAVIGGFAPGPVIVNNTIDQAGYAGIKADGAPRPLVIDSNLFNGSTPIIFDDDDTPISVEVPGAEEIGFAFGDYITDGLVMYIDAAGTRVAFEFEDIGGANVDPEGGSGQLGGDGFHDGHVPIYYSKFRAPYNPGINNVRIAAHLRHEVMQSIYQSIQGSILVTNGLVNLVNPTIGASPFFGNAIAEETYGAEVGYPSAAVYVEGASGIYFDRSFQKIGNAAQSDNNPFDQEGDVAATGAFPFFAVPAPVYEAPQPTTRIVNNTIFGADGDFGPAAVDANVDAGDITPDAVPLPVGVDQPETVTVTGTIGDGGASPASSDVDLYRVELNVGDRLILDVDSPDTALAVRFLDADGFDLERRIASPAAPVDPGEDPEDATERIDFTAPATGTYLLSISNVDNADFDLSTIDGRTGGDGNTGSFSFDATVLAPRSFVVSMFNGSNVVPDPDPGSQSVDFAALIGETITLTTVDDRVAGGENTNEFVFQFAQNSNPNAAGTVEDPFLINIGGDGDADDLRVPDLMEQIAETVRFVSQQNPDSGLRFLDREIEAYALGGNDGVNEFPGGTRGLIVYRETDAGSVDLDIGEGPQVPGQFGGLPEFQDGFGHNRTHQVGSIGRSGIIVRPDDPRDGVDRSSLDSFNGTTELYVLFERVADVQLSDGAGAAGLAIDFADADPTAAAGLSRLELGGADQLLPETGVMLTGGNSATVINNVFSTLHQSLVREETAELGFSSGPDLVNKPADVIATANVFQGDNPTNPVFRQRITVRQGATTNFPVPPTPGTGLSTDAATGPSNVNGGTDDFNITVDPTTNIFVNARGDNFTPAEGSVLIDSSLNAVTARPEETTLRQSVGIDSSNIVAPLRDGRGVLRVDLPGVAPPPGLGGNVFIDRGSTERADRVGPIAILVNPRDNDPEGVDNDDAETFISIPATNLETIRIQLRDTGDDSDPFRGVGVDDSTVVVSAIPGLRNAGANVTLFENDRALVEGVDYTFQYDQTQNIITLQSVAGVFRDDRSYRVRLNNGNSTVLSIPAADELADGQRLTITDTAGAEIVFEFDTGLPVTLPQPLTLIVPNSGVTDGTVVTIDDGAGNVRTFEFDNDGDLDFDDAVSIAIPVAGLTPLTPSEAASLLADAVNGEADLDVDARIDPIDDARIIIGADAGASVDTTGSRIRQSARTATLIITDAVFDDSDGDRFTVSDGIRTRTFEINLSGDVAQGSTEINLIGVTDVAAATEIFRRAIADSGVNAVPTNLGGGNLRLGLPETGSVNVAGTPLIARGIANPIVDGDTLTLTAGPQTLTVTFDRVDDDAFVPDGSETVVPVERTATSAELAAALADAVADALRSRQLIDGLTPSGIQAFDNGTVVVSGPADVSASTDSLALTVGQNAVSPGTTIDVRGDVLLAVTPSVLPRNGSIIQIGDRVFEFTRDNGPIGAGRLPIAFDRNDVGPQLAQTIADAIGAGATVTADGDVRLSVDPATFSLGLDADGDGVVDDDATIPTVLRSSRALVADGETFTIRRGGSEVTFEFQQTSGGGGVTAGNVPILFAEETVDDDGDFGAARDALADAIRDAIDGVGSLNLDPTVSAAGVALNDVPGTVLDLSGAPSLSRFGVVGGAQPVFILPSFGPAQVRAALVQAINNVTADDPSLTTLRASDLADGNLIVTGGALFAGPGSTFNLPAITDLVGNPLEANRPDGTTQFTIVPQNVGLDFGDAPDPREDNNVDVAVAGRYPTLRSSDGARHVVDPIGTPDRLFLGSRVDVDDDGSPSADADGDDTNVTFAGGGDLFEITRDGGTITVVPDATRQLAADGESFTITTGTRRVTFEYDIDGRFAEDVVAVRPVEVGTTSVAATLDALVTAVRSSDLGLDARTNDAGDGVIIDADDEDGVDFASSINPGGLINRGVPLVFDATVSGAGVLEAWIDFNADGDFTDPGEQILPVPVDAASRSRRAEFGLPETPASNIFGVGGGTRTYGLTVPSGVTLPAERTTTYARFRVSREGGLSPDGLAASGEVEDYAITVDPGTVPTIPGRNLTYTVREDVQLRAIDADGSIAGSDNDGILVGVVGGGPGGGVQLLSDNGDVRVIDGDGNPLNVPGLSVNADGTFIFTPSPNFNGSVSFNVLAQNSTPAGGGLVGPFPITVTIDVTPDNDAPEPIDAGNLTLTRPSNEDQVVEYSVDDLITPLFRPGPVGSGESMQPLRFASAGDAAGQTALGGSVQVVAGGQTLRYTPPAEAFGVTDSFTFRVIDVPPAGQTPRVAAALGTVNVPLQSVNDPPTAVADALIVDEGMMGVVSIATLLSNDSAGPQDEIDDGQTLDVDSFAVADQSVRGGTVRIENGNVIYQPPAFVSGNDSFTYTIADSEGATATGRVNVNIVDSNNPPRLSNPVDPRGTVARAVTVTEAGSSPRTVTRDLNDVFTDPDGDPLTFTVEGAGDDGGPIDITVNGSILTITVAPFANGSRTLTVTATDNPPVGLTSQSFTATVPVSITPVGNAVERVGTLDPLTGGESQTIFRDLSTVFRDRDPSPLNYAVSSFDGVSGSASAIAAAIDASDLIASIDFVGNQLRVTPIEGAFGSVDVAITASDGTTSATDTFTLTIAAQQDAPSVDPDAGFRAPIGGVLEPATPADGLLRFVTDLDGDAVTAEPTVGSVQGQFGRLQVFADGTFTYVSNGSGTIGDVATGVPPSVDRFDITFVDSTGLRTTASIPFTLTASRRQNPILSQAEDVNADGFITPIDALLVLNVLRRAGSGNVDVADLGPRDPAFPDANGNGRVTPLDALVVLNRLRRQNNSFGGESIVTADTSDADAWSPAATVAVAAADRSGFETRMAAIEPIRTSVTTESPRLGSAGPERLDDPIGPIDPPTVSVATDAILAGGLEIDRHVGFPAVSDYDTADSSGPIDSSITDAALSGWGDSDL